MACRMMTSGSQYTRLTYLSVLSAETGSPFGDTETDSPPSGTSSLAARRGAGRLVHPLSMTDAATEDVRRSLHMPTFPAHALGPFLAGQPCRSGFYPIAREMELVPWGNHLPGTARKPAPGQA